MTDSTTCEHHVSLPAKGMRTLYLMVIGLIYKDAPWLPVSGVHPAQVNALPREGALALGKGTSSAS